MTIANRDGLGADALEEALLKLLKDSWQNDGLAASMCMALLELVSPMGAFRGISWSHKQRMYATNERARRALKILKQICEYQNKYNKKDPISGHVNTPAFNDTKGVLWREMLHGWLETEDAAVEQELADGLLDAYAESTHGEVNLLEKTVRIALVNCRHDVARFARLLGRATSESSYVVTNTVAHRLVNWMNPLDLAKHFSPPPVAS